MWTLPSIYQPVIAMVSPFGHGAWGDDVVTRRPVPLEVAAKFDRAVSAGEVNSAENVGSFLRGRRV